jgi:hypothetical protein
MTVSEPRGSLTVILDVPYHLPHTHTLTPDYGLLMPATCRGIFFFFFKKAYRLFFFAVVHFKVFQEATTASCLPIVLVVVLVVVWNSVWRPLKV